VFHTPAPTRDMTDDGPALTPCCSVTFLDSRADAAYNQPIVSTKKARGSHHETDEEGREAYESRKVHRQVWVQEGLQGLLTPICGVEQPGSSSGP
jgi:hypothetical protein